MNAAAGAVCIFAGFVAVEAVMALLVGGIHYMFLLIWTVAFEACCRTVERD